MKKNKALLLQGLLLCHFIRKHLMPGIPGHNAGVKSTNSPTKRSHLFKIYYFAGIFYKACIL